MDLPREHALDQLGREPEVSEHDLSLRADGGQVAREPAYQARRTLERPLRNPVVGADLLDLQNGRQAAPSSRPKLPPNASIVTCSPTASAGLNFAIVFA